MVDFPSLRNIFTPNKPAATPAPAAPTTSAPANTTPPVPTGSTGSDSFSVGESNAGTKFSAFSNGVVSTLGDARKGILDGAESTGKVLKQVIPEVGVERMKDAGRYVQEKANQLPDTGFIEKKDKIAKEANSWAKENVPGYAKLFSVDGGEV